MSVLAILLGENLRSTAPEFVTFSRGWKPGTLITLDGRMVITRIMCLPISSWYFDGGFSEFGGTVELVDLEDAEKDQCREKGWDPDECIGVRSAR